MLATAKQTEFLIKLANERQYALPDGILSKRAASDLITRLLAMPKPRAATETPRITDAGMYRTSTGEIFKVQKSKTTQHLYAKKLIPIRGERLTEDDEIVGWEFDFAPGAMRLLTPGDRLTLDEAKAFGIRYGVCCVCGATLKDATSVANGIGPICAGRV